MLRSWISNMGCGGCAKDVAAILRKVDPDAQPTFDLAAREVFIATETKDAGGFTEALHTSGWTSEHLSG